MLQQKNRIFDSPKTLTELASFYKVNARTFKKWLQCNTLKEIVPIGYFYSIKDIEKIVDHLGTPEVE